MISIWHVSLRLPYPPKNLSPNARIGWQVRWAAAKRYKAACAAAAAEQLAPAMRKVPAGLIAATAVFHAPDRSRRDLDNAVAAAKGGL